MSQSIKGEAEFSIEEIVRFLLDQTCTREPPTNAERIARVLKLTVRGFFHHEYRLDPKIRAYLWPSKNEIGISRQLTPHRKKFSILHEVGHFVIPGHLDYLERDDMLLDDDHSLSDRSVVIVETEANRFAAHCIFQLERFQSDVDNISLNWTNISKMANYYDTSIIATARRWVEGSLRACALLVFVPATPEEPVNLRFSYAITSESFRQRYFKHLSRFTLDENSEAFRAFRDTRGSVGFVQTVIVELDEKQHDFEMKLFSTRYNVYGLIVP